MKKNKMLKFIFIISIVVLFFSTPGLCAGDIFINEPPGYIELNRSIIKITQGVHRISNNTIIPENTTLIFENGAKVYLEEGVTLTICGEISSDLQEIFTGPGEVVILSDMKLVYAQWWGAKGDGQTNDKNAFAKALTVAGAIQKPLYIPNGIYDLDGIVFNATDSVHIMGQDKKGTVLKNIGKITVNADLSIENITIIDTILNNTIELSPTSFCNITLRNVISYNTLSNFKDKQRANTFMKYSYSDMDKGINKIVVENCEFSYFASGVFHLACHIKEGTIKNCKFTEVGFDDNEFVSIILAGFQNNENITTAPAKNISILNNDFENIYSKNGILHESTEGHAILIYGSEISIKNNSIKNLYGGGRQPENLDSGYDHEAIYLKASYSVIENNRVENGVGNLADGAITLKGNSSYSRVALNTISGNYGMGIYTQATGIEIYGNRITLNGGRAGIFSGCNEVKIINNMITINGENNLFGVCVFSDNKEIKKQEDCNVSENLIFCNAGKGIYVLCDSVIYRNRIITRGIYGIYALGSSTTSIIENTVKMDGDAIDQMDSSCLFMAGEENTDNKFNIRKNNLSNMKEKNSPNPSACLVLYKIKHIILSENYMFSSTEWIVYNASPNTGGKSEIVNNTFIGPNSNEFLLNFLIHKVVLAINHNRFKEWVNEYLL